MRVLYILILPVLLTTGILAQGLSESSSLSGIKEQQSGIEIIEQQWNMRIHIPILDEDPLQDIYDRNKEIRLRKETLQQDKIRSQLGMPIEARQVQDNNKNDNNEEIPTNSGDPTAIYFYNAKIKNNTGKEIQAIAWDYVFFASGTKNEVGRRQFANKIKISPGKTGSLKVRSASPPTGSISATANKKSRPRYDEEVIIQTIEYADGSIWKAN